MKVSMMAKAEGENLLRSSILMMMMMMMMMITYLRVYERTDHLPERSDAGVKRMTLAKVINLREMFPFICHKNKF